MGLVIAGIDEAGYGPLLGPLCVGMAVLRVENWNEGDSAPSLWKMLSPQVSRQPGRGKRAGAIAVADSKKLKLANDTLQAHPVMHLERGVLSFLRCAGAPGVECDEQLMAALGAELNGHACYGGGPVLMPLAWTSSQIAIAANFLSKALARAGVGVLRLRCRAVSEGTFNEAVGRSGNKADVNLGAISLHVRHVWETWAGSGDAVRLVCDRLGGRAAYAGVLEKMIGGAGVSVEVVEETPVRSRYVVSGGDKRMGVTFQVEAEDSYLPVALASMTAKLVREIAMIRFNRYWQGVCSARGPDMELKPTYGYRGDAQRWLNDARGLLTAEDRRLLIRCV